MPIRTFDTLAQNQRQSLKKRVLPYGFAWFTEFAFLAFRTWRAGRAVHTGETLWPGSAVHGHLALVEESAKS